MIPDIRIFERFIEVFNAQPDWIARAPGRVNLIGEHTDYNGGFVMPAAIDREVKIAARMRPDRVLRVFSCNFGEQVSISLAEALQPRATERWSNYLLAVIDQFASRAVAAPGMDLAIWGDVPLGSGLSSSAAIEVAMATLLNAVTGAGVGPVDIALLAQAAEHSRFVGVNCGIMDQFISALGHEDAALMIDCHSLDFTRVPFDSGRAGILIIDSKKKRGLVDSEYNRRRQECAEGLKLMRELTGEPFETIRHIPAETFAAYADRLPEGARKRLRHNISENARVAAFAAALERDDFAGAGRLLAGSHASLRDDFEVSCRELDRIADIAGACDGVYGCRMTGGGFGGCAVALVRPDALETAASQIAGRYEAEMRVHPEIYATRPCEGATVLKAG